MIILHSESEYTIVCKSPGEECEHELPERIVAELGGESYCVHRLDRAVGGIMVYARTKSAAAALGEQMQNGSFEKEYLAENAQYAALAPVVLEPWDPMGTLAR